MFGWFRRKQRPRVVDIAAVLDGWRAIHRSGDTNIDTKRYIPGSIPTWTEWSGSSWVAARQQRLEAMEDQKLQMPDEIWLHFSLPPGWEPQHQNEHRAAQKWGRWLSETDWQPPSGRVPKPWQEPV